jgi:hypothetical protein
MSLSRVWMTKLSVASLTALVAPGAILGALVLLVIAGGFGGIGSLGQAFSGPSLPAMARPAPGAPRAALSKSRRTPSARSAATAVHGTPANHAIAGQTSRPAGGSSPGRPVSASIGAPATATVPAPARRTARPQSTSSAAPSPPPNPVRAVVDQVFSAGQSVSQQLPGPAGPGVSQALQAVGSTADQVLTGSAPAPPRTSAR